MKIEAKIDKNGKNIFAIDGENVEEVLGELDKVVSKESKKK